MTGLQILATVVVCADIGIVLVALLWPEPREKEHFDHRAASRVTALPTVPAEHARPHRGSGHTKLVRTLLESFSAPAQRRARRHSA